MEGRKLELVDENGNIISHWDEASNQAFDNTNVGLVSDNVQNALEEIANGTQSMSIELVDNAATLTKQISTGKFYKFRNAVSTLNLILVAPLGNNVPSYCGKFVAGSGCTVTIRTSTNEEVTIANGQLSFVSGKTYEFHIVDNVASFTVLGVTGTEATTAFNIVTLAIGSGSLDDCLSQAELNPTATFQWLLEETDGTDIVKKMVWHLSDGRIVDSLGYVYYTPPTSS